MLTAQHLGPRDVWAFFDGPPPPVQAPLRPLLAECWRRIGELRRLYFSGAHVLVWEDTKGARYVGLGTEAQAENLLEVVALQAPEVRSEVEVVKRVVGSAPSDGLVVIVVSLQGATVIRFAKVETPLGGADAA